MWIPYFFPLQGIPSGRMASEMSFRQHWLNYEVNEKEEFRNCTKNIKLLEQHLLRIKTGANAARMTNYKWRGLGRSFEQGVHFLKAAIGFPGFRALGVRPHKLLEHRTGHGELLQFEMRIGNF